MQKEITQWKGKHSMGVVLIAGRSIWMTHITGGDISRLIRISRKTTNPGPLAQFVRAEEFPKSLLDGSCRRKDRKYSYTASTGWSCFSFKQRRYRDDTYEVDFSHQKIYYSPVLRVGDAILWWGEVARNWRSTLLPLAEGNLPKHLDVLIEERPFTL